jgi:hemin uptake protein HemP
MAERGTSGAQRRPERQAGPGQDVPRRIAADVLLEGRRELIILHNADEYRLRVTSNGKLILTK